MNTMVFRFPETLEWPQRQPPLGTVGRLRPLSAIEERALLGGWNGRDVVVMLHGYFDESGEHGPDGKLVQLTLGGFIARWPEIEALCREWRAALDECNWREFHMREFASDEDKFDTWGPARKAQLDRFVEVLCRNVSHFCAFSFCVTNEDKAFADTYETALSRVMLDAEKVARRHDDRIRLIFAQSQEISGKLIGGYFDQSSNWTDRLEGWSVDRSRGSPPLQGV
jgi:hypothetical protein